ncbi:hypothetical protein [Aureimonas pseudogalii]|nr:hypothetical protein [Aureimonas pseudogalii]
MVRRPMLARMSLAADPVPSVEAAERLAEAFPAAVERFRRTVDPETD